MQALGQYIVSYTPAYTNVANRLARLIDDIAYEGAGPSNPNVFGLAGQTFLNWAELQWANMQVAIHSALAFHEDESSSWEDPNSFPATYTKDELK